MGMDVRVVEAAEVFSCTHTLALWPHTVQDFLQLGARALCPKFAAGSEPLSLSIREMQLILLKLALLLFFCSLFVCLALLFRHIRQRHFVDVGPGEQSSHQVEDGVAGGGNVAKRLTRWPKRMMSGMWSLLRCA